MRTLCFLTILGCVNGFGFGNLFGISLPPIPIPSGLLPTALPSIPELPSGLTIPTGIPTAFPSFAFPSIPVLTSRLPIISVPPLPSFEIPETALPSFAVPTELTDVFRSMEPIINGGLKSLGVSPLPTLDRGALASLRGAIPSFGDILKDGRDGLQEFIESYRGVQNRSLLIPSSESELRDLIRNKTSFNMDRLDSFVDSLGSKTGYDVAPSIRMIAGLVLQNTSSVYERATGEFQLYASRLRDGVQQVFNFNRSRIELPVLPDLQNKSLSFVQFASNPYSAIAGGNKINSSVVSIMISDLLSGNETVVSGLTNAINFTIPGDFSGFIPTETACVYWNENLAAWTTDGCALSALAASVATCSCNHLTDFAVAAQAPVASVPVQSASVVAAPSPMPPLPALQTTTPNIFMLPVGGTRLPSSDNNVGAVVVGGAVGGIAGAMLVFGALGYFMYRAERRKRLRRLTVKAVQEKNPAAGV
jgi:hypothetical protein